MKKYGKNLDLWNKSYFYRWYIPTNWFNAIRTFFRHIKYSYQRIKYGFCEMDTWNLDTHLTYLMANSIDYLADHACGYPGDNSPEGENPEAWTAYLKQISTLLRHSLEDEYYHNQYEDAVVKTFDKWTWEDTGDGFKRLNRNLSPEEEEVDRLWSEKEKDIWNKRQNDLYTALDMIKNRWYNLWD